MVILRLPEVKSLNGYRSDASIYNAIKIGLYPPGVAIGQRSKGWPDYEVVAIISARIAGYSDNQIRELVQKLLADRLNVFAVDL